MPRPTRRRFLFWTIGGLWAVLVAGYAGLASMFLSPRASAAEPLQDVGPVTQFTAGSPPQLVIYTGGGVEDGVYIAALPSGLVALDFHCTHLQCPIQWAGSSFACPCHGSTFSESGSVLGGPAPRPLHRHRLVVSGGRVQIGGIIS